MMTSSVEPQTIKSEVLQQLTQQISFEPDDFNLFFARVNSPNHRKQLIVELKEQLKALNIPTIEIAADTRTEDLLQPIRKVLKQLPSSNNELCIFIVDLDLSIQREDSAILNHLNFARELYRKQTPYPIVIWLSEDALTKLAQKSPDFWAWRSGVFEFSDDLSDSLAKFTLADGSRPIPADLRPPNPPIPFINREDLRRQTIKALTETPKTILLTGLTGIGGIGKTALAARIAHDVEPYFSGGVLWFALETKPTLETLYSQILRAYGVFERANTISEVRKILQKYHTLIIVDSA